MNYLEQFQTNIYALLVLVVLFFVMSKRLRVWTYGKKILLIVMIITAVGILSDVLSWVFDGASFFGAFFLEYLSNVVLFLVGPLLSCFMLAYIEYKMLDLQQNLVRKTLRFIPLWFTVIVLLINVFYPVYFSVNPDTNAYVREWFIWVHYVMLSVVYLYMMGIAWLNRNKVEKHIAPTFVIFFLLPMIGMAVQLNNIGVFYSWSFVVLSILVIYIFLESADGEIDFLTKLFNRQSYEAYVKQLIQDEKQFKLLYLDLDKFKRINDHYGHLAGDNVLIQFGQILQEVFPHEMVLRLGGDEFMVVIQHDGNPEQVQKEIMKRIQQAEEPLNTVAFSYGCQEYSAGMTIDEIYSAVDRKMYQHKRENQKLRRRSTD